MSKSDGMDAKTISTEFEKIAEAINGIGRITQYRNG